MFGNIFAKSTHVVVQPGTHIGLESFALALATTDGTISYKLDKDSKCFEATGTYGWFPDPFGDWGSEAMKALWALLSAFGGGQMDVVAALDDKIMVSFNNPTFGYPYTVFVEDGDSRQHNYYADEQHIYYDSKGRLYKCTRHEDSGNKEFTLEVCS